MRISDWSSDVCSSDLDGTSVEHLLKDLAATNSISWSRARNTVAKLNSYGLFETEGKSLVRLAPAERMDVPRWISERIVAELTATQTQTAAWSCKGRGPAKGDLTLAAMTLHPLQDGDASRVTE